MTLQREKTGDVNFNLKIQEEGGSFITNPEGATDLSDLCRAVEIIEGINNTAMRAHIVFEDSAGLIHSLRGTEIWIMTFSTALSDAAYRFRAYAIESRARSGNTESFMVQCVSEEYLINETTNIFGSSTQLFDKKTTSKDIVETILGQYIYGGGLSKNFFVEDSQNDHKFLACNWRAFDTIYWVANRSVRKTSSGTSPQNGFLFWENLMGFHFKSIDEMIDKAEEQDYDTKSKQDKGNARLYRYVYEPKKTESEESDEQKIESIIFPDDRNYLKGLRNGCWAGFSQVFDPTKLNDSILSGESTNFLPPYQYQMNEMWNKMSHLSPGTNPAESYTPNIKGLTETPRRIKYEFAPHHIFDAKGEKGSGKDGRNESEDKTYGDLPFLQAYKYLRIESLKTVRLLVTVPGNFDLYSGYGVEISIPKTKPRKDKYEVDKKYSGRYIIGGLRHKYSEGSVYTEMLLYRDSLPDKQ